MIIYDLEIKNAILNKGQVPEPGIKYCAGWNDHYNMGISSICTYDYDQDRYFVFCDDNMDKFHKQADETDLLIGFNNVAFDNEVICKNFEAGEYEDRLDFMNRKSYDLLQEIWVAACLDRNFQYPSHIGYGLGACIRANFPDLDKTGWGGNAPIDYQKGRWGTLISYNLDDVWLTKKLIDKIIDTGKIVNPTDPSMELYVTPPYIPVKLKRK